MASRLPFPRNPEYGTGNTRRRIRLRAGFGRLDGLLADTFHQMRCRIEHDGRQITFIDGEMLRIPNTSCPGAVGQLNEMVGWPLQRRAAEIYAGGRALHHCTHLLDLAVLTIAQAGRDEAERVYDAVVPDELEEPVTIYVDRNGARVHSWQVRQEQIVEPAALAGLPLIEGFAGWANKTFRGDALEAAMMLHRTCFVARGRRHLIEAWAGRPLIAHASATGVCFAYAPERIAQGVILGNNVRDFSQALDEDL